MNFIFGYSNQILLNKLFTFNQINSKKILFDNINLILQVNEIELENNADKYDKIFNDTLYLTNKNYCFDYEEIDKLLVFEKLLFEFVELELLHIEYYVEFISNLPEKFLLTYSNILRTKNYTISVLKNDYLDKSKKLIDLIKKNINLNN